MINKFLKMEFFITQELISISFQYKKKTFALTFSKKKECDAFLLKTKQQHPLKNILRSIQSKKKIECVIDAMSGFGDDALSLLSYNSSIIVKSYEKNPFIFFILKWRRKMLLTQFPDLEKRWPIQLGDFNNDLIALTSQKNILYYFDPLFSPDKKKSEPNNKIKLIHFLDNKNKTEQENIINDDLKHETLLNTLMASGLKEFIFKRPTKNYKNFGGNIPRKTFKGKIISFDLFKIAP